MSPEQSISREIRRLIVRFLVAAFGLRAKELLAGASTLEVLQAQHEVRSYTF
jgi:hypothetical protein